METGLSQSFLKRIEMMENLETPTLKMAKKHVGDSLSYMIYDSCSGSVSFKESIKEFGMELSLCGIDPTLWVSPSDLLIGKVCLKAPITSKCVQALTHDGILGIGTEIEQKYWNEMQNAKRQAIEDNERYLMNIMEVQKEELKERIEREEREKHAEEIARLTRTFEEMMRQIIDELETKIKHQRERMAYEKLMLEKRWKCRMDEEIECTVKKMTEQFLDELERQKEILEANFKEVMRKSECRKEVETEREKKKFKQTLTLLKHNLECKNFANMMYILCTERRKCHIEKETIEKYYQNRINRLKNCNEMKEEKIKELTQDRDDKARRVLARETTLKEILKQFQKFIYYALRASPTQAEFLLSMERMMMQVEENYEEQKRKDEEACEEKVSIHLDEPLPSTNETICEDDVSIPRFYYNTQLYKREDFPEKEESIPDNTEIENLMTILNVSVGRELKKSEETVKTEKSSAEIETEIQVIDESEFSKNETTKSDQVCSCCFKRAVEIGPIDVEQIGKEELKKLLLATSDSLEKIRKSLTSVERIAEISKKKTDPCKPPPVSLKNNLPNILSSQLSINKSLQSKASKARYNRSKGNKSNLSLPFVRDSVMLRQSSLERKSIDMAKASYQNIKRKFIAANAEVPLPVQSSKLIHVCDSLEIIRTNSKLSAYSADNYSDVFKRPEQIKEEEHADLSIISFKPKAIVYKTDNTKAIKQVKKMKRKVSQGSDNFLTKKGKAKVLGNCKGIEHLQTEEDFSDRRIHSIIEVMKKDSSTLRLFTACAR